MAADAGAILARTASGPGPSFKPAGPRLHKISLIYFFFILSMYSPDLVSTFITSPVSMNSGT